MAEHTPELCSFHAILGSQCGVDSMDKEARKSIPLLECVRDISSHKAKHSFSGAETEVELILARAAIFTSPQNIESWIICPGHRASLGVRWQQSSTKCSVPLSLSRHNEAVGKRPKAERGLSKAASQLVLRETGIFIAAGTGVCSKCRKLLGELPQKVTPVSPRSANEGEAIRGIQEMTLDEPIVEPSPVAHSTPGPCAAGLTIVDSATETPERSRYLPSDQSVLEASVGTPVAVHESSLDKLNTFLRSRDVSPVRNVLKTSWSEASERTQRRYVRKARQAVGVVLDEVAPARSDDQWKALVSCIQASFK